MEKNLKNIVENLPDTPGVYLYKDKDQKIIYVGKAKHLKRRVSSYFNRIHERGKTQMLVNKIRHIETILVETEWDALLLENNLIKKYQPRYNILLKDGKTYPWICVKNEPFPRIFSTRIRTRDSSRYFGPYPSVRLMNTLLELIHELYPLRNCALPLSEKNIQLGKFKVCLQYHIGKCKGPCEGLQTEDEYGEDIRHIMQIIGGNTSQVLRYLRDKMDKYSTALAFEKAHAIKQKIDILENYQSKSAVVSAVVHRVDVLNIAEQDGETAVNYLQVVNGSIIQVHTILVEYYGDESPAEILGFALRDFRTQFASDNKEIIVPFEPDYANTEGLHFTVPMQGDKKTLLQLSEKNAKYFLLERQQKKNNYVKQNPDKERLQTLQKDLRLSELPLHIECFDNSNLQGTNAVSACVVFKNGKPSPKDYRHFQVKTVIGANDFATMREVLTRRYTRLLAEGLSLPQLIVIDGGKGQLSSAVEVLSGLGLMGKIAIIGIAKRLEEIYYPNDPVPLYLDKMGSSLKIIQHLRDEAHRFGITYHRNLRSKESLQSGLDNIFGLGEKSKYLLLQTFKTVEEIKKASEEALQEALGHRGRGSKVYYFFNPLSQTNDE
jgi:excinuclease ABC subunit C